MKRQRPIPTAAPTQAEADAPSPAATTMSVKRQKTSHAAFAASQPLFDTLRNARDRLPDQGMYITVATNVVQQLHVGLKIEDGKNDVERHARYMDAIVEAWRCATDMYCGIFSQLATITAEKPEEGRGAAASHAEFKMMLESAQGAQKLAQDYRLAREKPDLPVVENEVKVNLKPELEPAVTSEKEEPKSSSVFPPSQPTPTPASKKNKKGDANTKYDKSGAMLLWEDGELQVPFSVLSTLEKKEYAIVRARTQRSKQKKKVAGIRNKDQNVNGTTKHSAESSTSHPAEATGAKTNTVPEVEFEDADAVAAEVALRMKAKEDAKRAKKAEKKRKRESGDSFVHDDEAVGHDPAAIAERPKKKKAKKSDSAAEAAVPENGTGSAKRKVSVEDAANSIGPAKDGAEKRATKKQKKSKKTSE